MTDTYIKHSELPAAAQGILHHWTVASAAARAALSPVSADVGKAAFQTDTKHLYLLTNATGPVWVDMTAAAASALINDSNVVGALVSDALNTLLLAQGALPISSDSNNASDAISITGALHRGKTLLCTGAGTGSPARITLTLPSDANDAAITVGSFGVVRWDGVGQPFFAAGSGATLSGTKIYIAASETEAMWHKKAANTYKISGSTST